VTCLAVGGEIGNVLFAGSWDKCVWSWDIASTEPLRKYEGHSDFVKAVVCGSLSGTEVLISGGADEKIMVWNANTGIRLHTLQDSTTTMMAVQHLAIDPVLTTPDSIILVSASSDPHIRRWRITMDNYEQLLEVDPDKPGADRPTIQEHDTSVYKVVFDHEGEDVDLLTASADGTVKLLSRARKFATEDVYEHRDYVRAVAVSDLWVISGGRDENVKVWDRLSAQLYCTLEGHYDEITDLVVLRNVGGRDVVCSVSIDGTIRTWPLDKSELDNVVKEIQEAGKPKEDSGNGPAESHSLMTAEEEAELAALMDED
jgi:WD40 repeat protein